MHALQLFSVYLYVVKRVVVRSLVKFKYSQHVFTHRVQYYTTPLKVCLYSALFTDAVRYHIQA